MSIVRVVRLWTNGAACLLLIVAAGCGNGDDPKNPREIKVDPGYNNLRNFRIAYMQATASLNRPPRNADEMKPFLLKYAVDPKELLKSARDGSDLVIQWGADLRTMKPQGDKWPIWVYEQNPHGGKRWVLQERNPRELTEAEFQASAFVPGMKD